jgi:hypothetical protein
MKDKAKQQFEVDEHIDILREKFKTKTGKDISRSRIVEFCLRNLLRKVESEEGIKEIIQELEQSNSEI